jgi:hypothetical protein
MTTSARFRPGNAGLTYGPDEGETLSSGDNVPLQCDNKGNLLVHEGRFVVGPITGSIFAIAVTASPVHYDFTTSGSLVALKTAAAAGAYVTLKAQGTDVYYSWSTATAGETVSATSTTTGMAQVLFNGERTDEVPPSGAKGLILLGSGSGFFRGHISNS